MNHVLSLKPFDHSLFSFLIHVSGESASLLSCMLQDASELYTLTSKTAVLNVNYNANYKVFCKLWAYGTPNAIKTGQVDYKLE